MIVIAHRGSSDEMPEHTTRAYQRAIDDGADGLECDVRLTADGVPVCIHDRRIDRTSSARGVVSAKTYTELTELDYATWKKPDARQTLEHDLPGRGTPASAEGLLRLDDLITLALGVGRPIGLSIETKHPVRFGGLVEERVLSLLRSKGVLEPDSPVRARIMSFSEGALRRVRGTAPGIPTVYLMDRIPGRCRTGWLPAGARIAGPEIQALRQHPEYVEQVHSAGSAVHAWVVDEDDDVELCLRLGVDGIITNRPREVIRIIRRSETDERPEHERA